MQLQGKLTVPLIQIKQMQGPAEHHPAALQQ
jgi:hypothetical protein